MKKLITLNALFARFATVAIAPTILLLIRLQWGIQFFLTGKGKLANLDRTTEYFRSLDIPAPGVNAAAAGTVECVGGLLLALGLGGRYVSAPLAFTMVVALATAHRADIAGTSKEPVMGFVDTLDKVLTLPPGPFLVASLVILAFGSGTFSLDALIARLVAPKKA